MSSSFRPLADEPAVPNETDHSNVASGSNLANEADEADNTFDPFGLIDMTSGGDCSAMIARLDIFLDGELTDERRDNIQSHLDSCPTCYEAFDFEAELRIVIRTKTVIEVPPELVARIRSALYGTA